MRLIHSPVDADELRRLARRFKKLDLDGNGALSVDEFMSLPELQQNPLVQRVIDIFDEDNNGEVDFKGEVRFVDFVKLSLQNSSAASRSSACAARRTRS